MATFNISHLNRLAQIKGLFPELTEKQFRLTMNWAMGMTLEDIASEFGSTAEAVKKTLQRSKSRIGADRLDTLRSIFLCRVLLSAFVGVQQFPMPLSEEALHSIDTEDD
ncbi:sigma-70 family RNA polymerase sigma factor [Salmonella enterica]